MYTIKYRSKALKDLKKIALYISEMLGSPKAAQSFIKDITDSVDSIRDFPHSQSLFCPIKALTHEYRRLVVGNYLVFYWVEDSTQTIIVARIIFNQRLSQNFLSDNHSAKEYR